MKYLQIAPTLILKNPMWNERYNTEEYIFGKKPNDFLIEMNREIPKGRVLCLAEGEGRNAVYLAQLGYSVTAVDSSNIGLAKAEKLAKENSVKIETILADLNDFKIESNAWDGIIFIFCHLPPNLRFSIFKQIVLGLKKGGILVLEAYSKEQLKYKTGGPNDLGLLIKLEDAKQELSGLQFKHALELEREIHEGTAHNGLSSVIQILAQK